MTKKPKSINVFGTKYYVGNGFFLIQEVGQNPRPIDMPIAAIKRLCNFYLKGCAYLESRKK